MCVLKLHLKCVCWNCTWNVCVETVPEMCEFHWCSVALFVWISFCFCVLISPNPKTYICFFSNRNFFFKFQTVSWSVYKRFCHNTYSILNWFHFKRRHVSGTVSTHRFQVQFQHAHFRCSFNTHISGAVSTHTFQLQFQHTHFRCSFNTHISIQQTKSHIQLRK